MREISGKTLRENEEDRYETLGEHDKEQHGPQVAHATRLVYKNLIE